MRKPLFEEFLEVEYLCMGGIESDACLEHEETGRVG